MGIGSGGNFDNTLILQVFVGRDHFCNKVCDAIKQNNLVFLAEVSAFINQGFEGFCCKIIRIDPGKVEPNLQVAEILLGEGFDSRSDRVLVRAITQIEQFLVAGKNRDDMVPVGIKEAGQDESLLFRGQLGCRDFSQCPVKILG